MKSKRVVLAIIAIVMAMTSLFAFVACDEKDDDTSKDNNGNGMVFDKDTTLQDIVRMIDDGEIQNYTLKYMEKNIDNIMGDSFTFFVTQQYWLYEYDDGEIKGLSGFVFEDDGAYLINYHYGNEISVLYYDVIIEDIIATCDTTNYYLGKYDGQFGSEHSENLDIVVSEGEISWTRNQIYEYGESEEIYFTLYNCNSTEVVLPDALKNYKELAVKPEEE